MDRKDILRLHILAQLPNISGTKRLDAACKIEGLGIEGRLTYEEQVKTRSEVVRRSALKDPFSPVANMFEDLFGGLF